MKLDREVRSFIEKYDREAMQCIDELCSDFGIGIKKIGTQGFNVNESIDIFNQYLHGYMQYKLENKNNENATNQDTIKESVKTFIDQNIFKEQFIPYKEMTGVIKSYLENIKSLSESVDEIVGTMMENDIDQESIGDVSEFAEMFLDEFHKRFDPLMENVVIASGYATRQKLFNNKTKTENVPVFL